MMKFLPVLVLLLSPLASNASSCSSLQASQASALRAFCGKSSELSAETTSSIRKTAQKFNATCGVSAAEGYVEGLIATVKSSDKEECQKTIDVQLLANAYSSNRAANRDFRH